MAAIKEDRGKLDLTRYDLAAKVRIMEWQA